MSLAVAREGRAFSIADLDTFPADDGLRYQLLEGTLVVSPSPIRMHQRVAFRLARLLDRACPPHLEVFAAAVDLKLAESTVLIPDVVVDQRHLTRGPRFPETPPLLVVEVLSPSTRLFDLGAKRLAYRDGGVEAYWIADPAVPSVRVIEWLGDGEHERVVRGRASLDVDHPFPVEICPDDLIRD